MCGIAGVWRKKGRVTSEEIVRMSEFIAHRGPDDYGHVMINTMGRQPLVHFMDRKHVSEGYDLALANRRLSIIDLTEGGHQPMTRDGCTIVYNGEIYNYVELQAELAAKGHVFLSTSDTEVLLHAYLEWGTDCLTHLNGMFAFAVWDARKQTLFCARDRLGIKPFYYKLSQNEFIFASEIKSILSVLPRKPVVNEGVVYDFLSVGWLDHTDETFFDGILRLPAGSFMLVTPEHAKINKYWDLSGSGQTCLSLDENAEKFRELFNDVVRLQMRSDVTVGCCLSGGMDSTALVSVAAPLSPHRMRTFTARYHDATMDEWRYVQSVSSRIPIDAVSVFVDSKDFWHTLADVLWSQEEPFLTPSMYAQWSLMRTIKASGISVVLDGQGGDELLCGYAKFFYFWLSDLWSRGRLGDIVFTLVLATMNGGTHLLNYNAAKRYLPQWLNQSGSGLLRPDFSRRHADRSASRLGTDLKGQQILDIEKFSLPALLRYEDKNSMAHSVESRVPFLDHRLVEFSVNLPSEHKLRGGQSKLVMRRTLADIMPIEVLNRRTKLGFGGSFSSWIIELKPLLEEWVNSDDIAIDLYVHRDTLRELLSRRDPALFRYLILDKWFERFEYS